MWALPLAIALAYRGSSILVYDRERRPSLCQ
jgi:hypothetical protein